MVLMKRGRPCNVATLQRTSLSSSTFRRSDRRAKRFTSSIKSSASSSVSKYVLQQATGVDQRCVRSAGRREKHRVAAVHGRSETTYLSLGSNSML